MRVPKQKHMRFEDRLHIQHLLDEKESFTAISRVINKDRTTVAREVFNHRFPRYHCKPAVNTACEKLAKPPYVCNACPKKAHCTKDRFFYDAAIAENEYQHLKRESRSCLQISKGEIADINQLITPLMRERHHSVNQLFANHGDQLPFSRSTFYRYVDLGIFDVKNIDLPRRVRFRVKKQYDTTRHKTDPKIKLGRFYTDFQDYTALHPDASIVEMDTVIGTAGGKGGKCFLTLYFRTCKLMLIYVLAYKKVIHVNEVFDHLKSVLGETDFSKLFEVILTDNGTEFSDPDYIECNPFIDSDGKLVNLFYCDPHCSWQKGSIEKNHEYIRYILPKGTSFAGLSQEQCYKLASHINSVPRLSLNNSTPYKMAEAILSKKILEKLHIYSVAADDVNLSPALLRK